MGKERTNNFEGASINDQEVVVNNEYDWNKCLSEVDFFINQEKESEELKEQQEQEIDKKMKEREDFLEKTENIQQSLEYRIDKVEKYNPFKEVNLKEPLSLEDIEEFFKQEVVDKSEKGFLVKSGQIIDKFQLLKNPSVEAEDKISSIVDHRRDVLETIKGYIAEKELETSFRKEEIKCKLFLHHNKRIDALQTAICEIEKDPGVIEKIKSLAEEKRKIAEEKMSAEREEIMAEISRLAQSANAKHANTFNRIKKIIGDDINEELISLLNQENQGKEQSILKRVRDSLKESIINESGVKQIKNPKEIVPWDHQANSVKYISSIEFLKDYILEEELKYLSDNGDKKAQELLEEIETILTENKVLRLLIGKKYIKNKTNGKKELGQFYSYFQTRENNDKNGITEKRRKAKEEIEKQEAKFFELAKGLVEKGGIIIDVPIFQKIRGENRVINYEKGVIVLEKRTSKKDNQYWIVTETLGAGNSFKGKTSSLNMRSFPECIYQAAERSYIKKGDDFINKIDYSEEKE